MPSSFGGTTHSRAAFAARRKALKATASSVHTRSVRDPSEARTGESDLQPPPVQTRGTVVEQLLACMEHHGLRRVQRDDDGANTHTTDTPQLRHSLQKTVTSVVYCCVICDVDITATLGDDGPSRADLAAAVYHTSSASHRHYARYMNLPEVDASLKRHVQPNARLYTTSVVNGISTLICKLPGGSEVFHPNSDETNQAVAGLHKQRGFMSDQEYATYGLKRLRELQSQRPVVSSSDRRRMLWPQERSKTFLYSPELLVHVPSDDKVDVSSDDDSSTDDGHPGGNLKRRYVQARDECVAFQLQKRRAADRWSTERIPQKRVAGGVTRIPVADEGFIRLTATPARTVVVQQPEGPHRLMMPLRSSMAGSAALMPSQLTEEALRSLGESKTFSRLQGRHEGSTAIEASCSESDVAEYDEDLLV